MSEILQEHFNTIQINNNKCYFPKGIEMVELCSTSIKVDNITLPFNIDHFNNVKSKWIALKKAKINENVELIESENDNDVIIFILDIYEVVCTPEYRVAIINHLKQYFDLNDNFNTPEFENNKYKGMHFITNTIFEYKDKKYNFGVNVIQGLNEKKNKKSNVQFYHVDYFNKLNFNNIISELINKYFQWLGIYDSGSREIYYDGNYISQIF